MTLVTAAVMVASFPTSRPLFLTDPSRPFHSAACRWRLASLLATLCDAADRVRGRPRDLREVRELGPPVYETQGMEKVDDTLTPNGASVSVAATLRSRCWPP